MDNKTWIATTAAQAQAGGHIFPQYAAAEAALESAHAGVFGASGLAVQDNNLFGTKQHQHPVYGTHNIPTREFLDPDGPGPLPREWKVVNAAWVHYPDLASCFSDRMATLQRLRHAYPHYDAALNATNGETYVREVSQTWSTDPARGDKVLQIFKLYFAS